MNQPKISIIIPNWNGLGFLPDCLKSLAKVYYGNYRIAVVDNGSSDGSVDFLKNNFPAVAVIENKINLGFAAACNQGIKYALGKGADYVLLLNNDTVVAPDFLSKMAEAAEAEEKIGLVGAKIYYFDQPEKIWFAGGKFIRWRASGKHLSWQKNDHPTLSGTRECDFITGCAVLIKKEVFSQIGFFFEPYFLTVEDLDFSYRAGRAGWKIVTALDAKIWHKVSSSRLGEFSFSNGYYGMRNRLHFAKQNGNWLGIFVFVVLVTPLRTIQWLIQGKFKMLKGMLFGLRDFFRGRLGEFKP